MVSKSTLDLFQRAAKDVPAYKDFLKREGIDPSSIKTVEDFKKVPKTSKKTYLQRYSLPELLWGGTLNVPLVFCSTSGSTGEPFYFPRNESLAEQYSWIIQEFLERRIPKEKSKPILVINAFGMGVWIGGILTHNAFEIASRRMGIGISILPVGYNKNEVIKALQKLSTKFGQTIIIGYPPFIKEIIDESLQQKINLWSYNTRLIFAAEAFTETFRDYICGKTGADPYIDTLNIYGSADLGAMAYETPISILTRRLARRNPLLFQDIFGQIEKTPTLAQFNPNFIEFEKTEGEVVLTGDSALPLIRYSLGDHGGVLDYEKVMTLLGRNDVNVKEKIDKLGIPTPNKYPFVFVYERSDFSVTLHGINIYPEFIKEGLLDPEVINYVTEKFTMITKFDRRHNQYLEINLELQKRVEPQKKIKAHTKKIIRQKLIEKSSEFAEISKSPKSKNLVRLVFWPYEHPKYFAPGVKQKWVLHQ
jgi:phenylacetate-CoA ligase